MILVKDFIQPILDNVTFDIQCFPDDSFESYCIEEDVSYSKVLKFYSNCKVCHVYPQGVFKMKLAVQIIRKYELVPMAGTQKESWI